MSVGSTTGRRGEITILHMHSVA